MGGRRRGARHPGHATVRGGPLPRLLQAQQLDVVRADAEHVRVPAAEERGRECLFAHPHFTRDGARLARVVRKKRASASTWEDVDAEGKSLAAEDVARAAAPGVDWRHRCRSSGGASTSSEAENARLRDEPAAVPRQREPSDRTTFCDDLFSPKRRRSGGCF